MFWVCGHPKSLTFLFLSVQVTFHKSYIFFSFFFLKIHFRKRVWKRGERQRQGMQSLHWAWSWNGGPKGEFDLTILVSWPQWKPRVGCLTDSTIQIPQLNTFFKKILSTYSWETHTHTQSERRRHRQREKQTPCEEPSVALDPRTPRSWPEPKADTQQLSHPGAP